jgi:hypothetical protein
MSEITVEIDNITHGFKSAHSGRSGEIVVNCLCGTKFEYYDITITTDGNNIDCLYCNDEINAKN